jgi:RimJ/RimL family protein N-acetyltransferase
VTDQPVLAGSTVTLRPLSLADAAGLAAAAAESRQHYTYTRVPDGLAEAESYIAAALRDREIGHRMPFVTLWREQVVGCTSYLDLQQWRWPAGSPLQRTDAPDAVEIGATWLSASAQRTRCNTEAKYLMLTHAFDVWRVHRVALKTDERNSRSRQAIERLGARLEGVRRADMPGQDGSVRSSAYYSIVRAEWPAIRARLEETLRRPW